MPFSPLPSILACECSAQPTVDAESGAPCFAAAAAAEPAAADETAAAAAAAADGVAGLAAADEAAAIVSADECDESVEVDEAVEDEGDKQHVVECSSPFQSLPVIRPSFGL